MSVRNAILGLLAQKPRHGYELHAAFSAVVGGGNWDVKLAQILLLDKAIMHLEADLRWLDMIEMRIESIKDQPLAEVEIRKRGRPKKELPSAEQTVLKPEE